MKLSHFLNKLIFEEEKKVFLILSSFSGLILSQSEEQWAQVRHLIGIYVLLNVIYKVVGVIGKRLKL